MSTWIERIADSADTGATDLPSFPPAAVQERFVGRSGRAAIEAVVPFFNLIKERSSLAPSSTVLDFGVGWGRIARLFQDQVDAQNLYLADVDQEALGWCRKCNVVGTPVLLELTGRLPFANKSLDVVYSYSVFSHLSESAAQHWFAEIARALRPGGLFVFTTQSMRFLNLVRACYEKEHPNEIEAHIGNYMGDPYEAIERFQSGKHTYSGVGGGGVLSGEFYGWAAIPPDWFSQHYGQLLPVESYLDDGAISEQAVYVARKER